MTQPRRPAARVLAVALAASLWSAAVAPAVTASGAPERIRSALVDADLPVPHALAADDAETLAAADPRGRVLVWWQPGTSSARRAELTAAAAVGVALADDIDAFDVGRAGAADLVARLEGLAEVEAVTVDREIELAATRPDDPRFAEQWGLENTGTLMLDGRLARAGLDVRALGAWELTRGDTSVTVAMVDTGVDPDHPDLAGALWQNPGETADGQDSDDNGLIDDLQGWDFMHGRSSIYEDPIIDQHGTHVAGVIAARSDDGVGIAGVAPAVTLMVLKAFAIDPVTGAGTGSLSTVIPAMLYAVAEGADIINVSWVTTIDDPMLRQVISRAGVPVVAAAGNGDGFGQGLDLSVDAGVFPASYDLPNLITVTALDHQGLVPPFANRGVATVNVGAPGTDIVTVHPGGGHRSVSGTSFAAPFVSGALALAAGVAPYADAADLVDALERTTRYQTGLVGLTTAAGVVDAAALVRGVQRPVCRPDRQPASDFQDVGRDGAHTANIDCLVAQEVARGRSAEEFAPAATVTRGQMATFLVRVLEREEQITSTWPEGEPTFVDVEGHVHERSVAALAALEIVLVGPDRRFRPDDPVTRGQAASLVVRTHTAADGRVRTPSRTWFTDVAGSVHADNVARARDLGIVRGTDRVRYAPGEWLRRDQMASVLARLLDSLAREYPVGDGSAETGS